SLSAHVHPPPLPPFPTRRSSDLVAPAPPRGRPRVFVSHGTADTVLPIDQCSRRIVPRLRQASYDVMYQEFEGPHTVPPEIAESRSEEHTSELQSLRHLVCRLLLE